MRLLLACAGIATVFGTATYLARYDIIGQDAVVHGINVVEQLRARVRLIADEPGVTLAAAIQRALDQGSDRRLLSRHGGFTFARFYTPDGATLAQRAFPGAPPPALLEAYLRQAGMQYFRI
jgi:hypothetical protein